MSQDRDHAASSGSRSHPPAIPSPSASSRRRAAVAVVVYAVLYVASIARLRGAPGFAAGETLAVFVIFGLGLSAIAAALTRGVRPHPWDVRAPGRELATVLAYLAVFSIVVLGWGLSAVRAAVPEGPGRELTILALKLATMVGVPVALFAFHGYPWKMQLAWRRPAGREWMAFVVMAALLALLQATVGRGFRALGALEVSPWTMWAAAPVVWLAMTLEAGLPEEFLFRAALQSRAAAWLRSETAGIAVMALCFGLAHAPGYVLRGAHAMEGMSAAPDPLTAAAYAVAVVSPVGILFGVLWARTRNLWLLAILHGWGDLFPHLAPWIRTWLTR